MEKKISNVVIWAERPEEISAIESVLWQKKFSYNINMELLCAKVFESLAPSEWDQVMDEIMERVNVLNLAEETYGNK